MTNKDKAIEACAAAKASVTEMAAGVFSSRKLTAEEKLKVAATAEETNQGLDLAIALINAGTEE